jgi:hypothetical protein
MEWNGREGPGAIGNVTARRSRCGWPTVNLVPVRERDEFIPLCRVSPDVPSLSVCPRCGGRVTRSSLTIVG